MEFKEARNCGIIIIEAEYVAESATTRQVLWLRMLLDDFCIEQVKATEVYYDNRSAIEMVKNHAFHGKNKKFGVCNFESKENVD